MHQGCRGNKNVADEQCLEGCMDYNSNCTSQKLDDTFPFRSPSIIYRTIDEPVSMRKETWANNNVKFLVSALAGNQRAKFSRPLSVG